MAKVKTTTTILHTSKSRKRKGVHKKSNNSNIKTAKTYKKKYRGQGR